MCWARGNLAIATWLRLASGLGLTLILPSPTRAEILLASPQNAALLDVLLAQPTVVVVDQPCERDRLLIDTTHHRAGVFDPVASCVVSLCRERGWPALSSDPARLRRLDPDLDIDLL